MLVAKGAVEIRVLSRQGKSIREIARMLEVICFQTDPVRPMGADFATIRSRRDRLPRRRSNVDFAH